MTERPGVSHSSPATPRHSKPFFISTKLFRNKHLKAKRLRWLHKRLIINATGLVFKHNAYHQQLKKTDYRFNQQQKPPPSKTPLLPSITIDLLSDDDESPDNNQIIHNNNYNKQFSQTYRKSNGDVVSNFMNGDPLQPCTAQQNLVPQLMMFQGNMQLCQVPNITLLPVVGQQPTTMPKLIPLKKGGEGTFEQSDCSNFSKSINSRRQRKPQIPKRLPAPIIVNTESIVLSDDDDDEDSREPEEPVACSTPTITISSVDLPQPLHINIDPERYTTHNAQNSNAFAQRNKPVPEEVTVSLVPRSSTAGSSCSSRSVAPCTNGGDTFPMLPDETTVHTVIANRTYELPLAKLREGLAISGAAEFTDNSKQQTALLMNSYRKNAKINTPPALLSPSAQQPVSLKLSSDLSISLISDDEDDPVQQHLNAEKLLRQQPHLSVRPVGGGSNNLAACSSSSSTSRNHRETQKRRKLG